MLDILFVTHNQGIYNDLNEILKREGYTLRHTNDLDSAVDMTREKKLNMVIVDVCCFGEDVNELLKKVKRKNDLPIVGGYISPGKSVPLLMKFHFTFSCLEDIFKIIPKTTDGYFEGGYEIKNVA